MKLVVDASVALKWFFHDRPEEAHVDKALAILAAIRDGDAEIQQPSHWLAEIMAVIAREMPELAADTLMTLKSLKLPTVDDEEIFRKAVDLAIELNHHLFDTLYHALALERDAVLVTADQRYYGKAKDFGGIILLADFEISR